MNTLFKTLSLITGLFCASLFGMESKQLSPQLLKEVDNFIVYLKACMHERAMNAPVYDRLFDQVFCNKYFLNEEEYEQLKKDMISFFTKHLDTPHEEFENVLKIPLLPPVDKIKEKMSFKSKKAYSFKEVAEHLRNNIECIKHAKSYISLTNKFDGMCIDTKNNFIIWLAALLSVKDSTLISIMKDASWFIKSMPLRTILRAKVMFIFNMPMIDHISVIDLLDQLTTMINIPQTKEKALMHLNELLAILDDIAQEYTLQKYQRLITTAEKVIKDMPTIISTKRYLPRIAIGAAITAGLGVLGVIAYKYFKRRHN